MTDLGNPWPEGLAEHEKKQHTSLSTRVDILHHAKLVSEVLILHSRQRLGENVHYLLICGYVLELYSSSLHHVSDVMNSMLFDMKERVL
jgi:hypothetical protein